MPWIYTYLQIEKKEKEKKKTHTELKTMNIQMNYKLSIKWKVTQNEMPVYALDDFSI